MLQEVKFDYQKATQAINYLILNSKDKKIDKLKALKLIWAADRYHLRKYGRPIIGDKYIAMEKGPVASSVKDLMESTVYLGDEERQYSSKYIKCLDNRTLMSLSNIDEDVFSDSDLEALRFAIDNFSEMDSFELSKLTHEYPEWKKYETELESGRSKWKQINYSDFFKNPTDVMDDKFYLDREDLEESKQAFQDKIRLINLL